MESNSARAGRFLHGPNTFLLSTKHHEQLCFLQIRLQCRPGMRVKMQMLVVSDVHHEIRPLQSPKLRHLTGMVARTFVCLCSITDQWHKQQQEMSLAGMTWQHIPDD